MWIFNLTEAPRRLLGELAAAGLAPTSLTLSVYFLGLGAAHSFLLPQPAAFWMTALALGTAIKLLILYAFTCSKTWSPSAGNAGQAFIGALVLLNCLAALALTGSLNQTSNLALAVIGGGLLLYDPLVWFGYHALAGAGWAIVAAFLPIDLRGVMQFGLMLLGAAFISALGYRLRLRSLFQLEGAQARLRAERQSRPFLERAQQARKFESLGRMAAGITHDFNNLLTVVSGNAELWMKSSPPSADGRELVENILSAADRGAALTQQILTYAGRAQTHMQATSLATEVRAQEAELRSLVDPQIRLEVSVDRETPPILGDAAQIAKVLTNLVTNAAEAIQPRTGQISVRVLKEADTNAVRLEVEDDGPGILAEDLPYIFDPFFSTAAGGRGLGLAVVHGILRSHGATVRVDSEADAGARFSIRFPAMGSPTIQPGESGEIGGALASSGYALVVGRDAARRAETARMLRRCGFLTIESSKAAEAVIASRERPSQIALLVMDSEPSTARCAEALEQFRDAGYAAPVICIGERGELESQRAANQKQAVFLPRPFDAGALVEAAGRALAMRASPPLDQRKAAKRAASSSS